MGSSKSKTAPEPAPVPPPVAPPAPVQKKQNPPAPPAPTEPPPPVYGTYTPSTEFPSPALLASAQRDYLAANVEHPVDSDGIPSPFPPPTAKDEVFRLEDYTAIDNHALQTPLSIAATTYEDLAKHLVSPAQNDIGKVRALFVWISGQGLAKIHAYCNQNDDVDEESPLFLLYRILVFRRGGSYVNLLADLCRAANIPVKIVQNDMVRAMNYTVGDEKINGGNRHCLVYVDKAWRIIDQHWGSEGVIVTANRDWDLIAGQGKTAKEPDELQYVYARDEHYFLTDPEKHVFQHWCPNKEEQLLARPVSEEEFLKFAYVKRAFFKLGFTSMSHPTCRVSTDSGQIVFKFGLPPGKKVDTIFSLYKWKYVKESNEIEGAALERYVLVANTNEGLEVTINFRLYGKHRLELYGLIDGQFSYSSICEYLIFVNKPDHLARPYPKTINNFGMSPKSTEVGIEPADSTLGGTIFAENGFATIRFHRTKKSSIEFVHELTSEDVDASTDLRNCIRQYATETEVVFLVYLPKNGQYLFKLRGRQPNQWKETHLCQYLITSDRGCVEPVPFPKSNTNRDQIGNVAKDEHVYVIPDSHPGPYIDWQDQVVEFRGGNIYSPT